MHILREQDGSNSWVGSRNASILLEKSTSRVRLGVTGSHHLTENQQQQQQNPTQYHLHKGNTKQLF